MPTSSPAIAPRRRGPIAWVRRQLEELYALLLAPDFIVDDKPIPLSSGPLTTMELSILEEDEKTGPRDVITLVSMMMRREEKAHQEAEAARNRPVEDKQFSLLIKQMLPFLDSFDHVLEAARDMPPSDEVNNWLKSVEMLYFRVLRIFERFGLVQLRTIGQPVNLDFHDVVEYRFSAHHEADTVIAERQRGYVLDNKLLRDAKVVIARSPRS